MSNGRTWQEELRIVVDLMRAISRESDPQEVVRIYGDGIDLLHPSEEWISVSRRGLQRPWVRVTRSSRMDENINPWTQRDRLPLINGGLLEEWIYSNEPRYDQDFQADPKDPAYEYLKGIGSYFTMPQFDDGEALNLTAVLHHKPGQVVTDRLPDQVWRANLFGRGVANLVLRKQLSEAYEALDREFKSVGEIQRALLPQELPKISGLDLAAYYRTSQRAGGDYYDVFPLPEGCWGLFMADVSGHGTPAAVMMAITHALAHAMPGPPTPPSEVLAHLNTKLHAGYTSENGSFVTAFYGVYHSRTKTLRYASAGHPPARLRRGGETRALDAVGGLPLGVLDGQSYEESEVALRTGDLVVFYTDGISEAMGQAPPGARASLFEEFRLDAAIGPPDANVGTAQEVIERIVQSVDTFTANAPPTDDRTMLVARVTG